MLDAVIVFLSIVLVTALALTVIVMTFLIIPEVLERMVEIKKAWKKLRGDKLNDRR